MRCAQFLLIAAVLPFDGVEAKPVTVELGGMRQVTAVIKITEEDYEIRVRFLPVRCFDKTTNSAMNQRKGRDYALQALARHLLNKDAGTLTTSGVVVLGTAPDGKNFQTLALRVPRKATVIVTNDAVPPLKSGVKPEVEKIHFSSALLTRNREYQETLDLLARQLETSLQTLVNDKRGFELAIADLEEKTVKNLEALAGEIGKDQLLLSVEKTDLLDALHRTQHRAIARLKETVERFEKQSSTEKPQ